MSGSHSPSPFDIARRDGAAGPLGGVRVLDVAPRFRRFGRIYRVFLQAEPESTARLVRPLE